MKYISFNLIYSTNIPRTWPHKKTQIEFRWYVTRFLQLFCADFPIKLRMQIKKRAWNIQYNQCNLAAHTGIAHNHSSNQACLW